MRGHHLGLLKGAAVGEVDRDPDCPEGVATDEFGSRPLSPADRSSRGPAGGSSDVLIEVRLEAVVHRHLVVLAALLVQPEPPALALGEVASTNIESAALIRAKL
jgi:hypothetical protein